MKAHALPGSSRQAAAAAARWIAKSFPAGSAGWPAGAAAVYGVTLLP